MDIPIDHSLDQPVYPVGRDLSGMPEAFRRACGPTDAFPDDLGVLKREAVAVFGYRGRRTINPRSRGSCRIFAVFPDKETGSPRVYGLDSQLEYHHLALTLVDDSVQQVLEQFGPIRFRQEDGSYGTHYFDLLITYKSGRRVAVAVKPNARITSGRFVRELKQISRTKPFGTADEVRLVTEQSFSRTKAMNAVTYLRFALCPDPEADERMNSTLANIPGELTIADLVRISRTGPRGFRAAVRSIYEKRLVLMSIGRINLHSIVRRPQ